VATEKPKRKKLKSLSLPGSVTTELESLAEKTGCTQANLVRIALNDLNKLNDDELEAKLTEYQLI